MTARKLPSIDYLNECFFIDDNAELLWKERPLSHFKNHHGMRSFNSRYCGKRAGFVSKNQHGKPYLKVTLLGVYFYAHRIIAKISGILTDEAMEVDHINGNGLDNNISNLRVTDRIENCRNQRIHSNNSSGVCGVHFDRQSSKWKATITSNGKKRTIGLFSDKNDAIKARKNAESHYGFHPNHGTERDL